jgi:small subunit ribosomal protein S20
MVFNFGFMPVEESMANHKSALKRHRQSVVRALRNKHYRSTMKTLVKKARSAVAEGAADAEAAVKTAIAMVDRIGGKGIIPKNRASRYASKLTRLLQK